MIWTKLGKNIGQHQIKRRQSSQWVAYVETGVYSISVLIANWEVIVFIILRGLNRRRIVWKFWMSFWRFFLKPFCYHKLTDCLKACHGRSQQQSQQHIQGFWDIVKFRICFCLEYQGFWGHNTVLKIGGKHFVRLLSYVTDYLFPFCFETIILNFSVGLRWNLTFGDL